jgi:hypothetical protein
MKNQELFKEAIADAQAVRNAALANAKKSLEEAFAPKVESMLTKKLAEMESTDESAGAEQNESADAQNESAEQNESQKGSMEEELDSLLKELGMDEGDETNESSTDIDTSTDDLTREGEEGMEEPEMGSEEGGEELGGAEGGAEFGAEGGEEQPQEVVDMTVDQLLGAIRSTIQSVMGGGAEGGEELGGEMGGDEFAGDIAGGDALAGGGEEQSPDEVNLEELLAELENEGVDEARSWEDAKGKGGSVGAPKNGGQKGFIKMKMSENEKAANEARSWEDAKGKGGSVGAPKNGGQKGFIKMKMSETEKANEAKKVEETKELAEAIKVIKALKSSLNEVNLLNAKLLYVNKIFKAKSLTESQKVKVVSAFDKANTVKDAKVIYESLNEAFSAKKKVAIRESYGLASKPVAGAPKKQAIVESAGVTRFQQLAGIKPLYS